MTGRFRFGLGEGEINGVVQGDTLDYEWTWGSAYGSGRLVAGPSGGLKGAWGYMASADGGGSWDVSPQ